jgi:hypothetical protein
VGCLHCIYFHFHLHNIHSSPCFCCALVYVAEQRGNETDWSLLLCELFPSSVALAFAFVALCLWCIYIPSAFFLIRFLLGLEEEGKQLSGHKKACTV